MPNSFHSKAEIEEAIDSVKKEIRKEMKIKEGAERLREATNDKKSLNHIQSIVKKANNRLQELQQELNELSTYLLVSNSLGGDIIDGEWKYYLLEIDLLLVITDLHSFIWV